MLSVPSAEHLEQQDVVAHYEQTWSHAGATSPISPSPISCSHVVSETCSRATAARWVASARQDLLDGTKAQLARELALSGEEVESVIRVVRSRLDLSVERLLRG